MSRTGYSCFKPAEKQDWKDFLVFLWLHRNSRILDVLDQKNWAQNLKMHKWIYNRQKMTQHFFATFYTTDKSDTVYVASWKSPISKHRWCAYTIRVLGKNYFGVINSKTGKDQNFS